jgi:hypothetical protein
MRSAVLRRQQSDRMRLTQMQQLAAGGSICTLVASRNQLRLILCMLQLSCCSSQSAAASVSISTNSSGAAGRMVAG